MELDDSATRNDRGWGLLVAVHCETWLDLSKMIFYENP